MPVAVPPPDLDEARIGGCEYPHFPWNDWERWAVASGLAPDLAGLGGLVVREAYNHGWPERLCALAGWCDGGGELLAFALRSPEMARRHWEIPLRTDGLRGDIPPGSTDWTWAYSAARGLGDPETIRRGKGHKDRVVPVGARAIHWLERYLAEVRQWLCLDTRETALFLTAYGGPFNPDVVSRMVREWMESLGIKGSCHLLRHTCATHMLEGGADIRFIHQLLGHAKLDTTAIYAEVSILQLQEVHARCHPSARLPENHQPVGSCS